MIAWTWGKWPDALIDFGRELYVPWQLSLGKRLYSDIAYFNGPLSPWLNALLFRCFGASLRTLVAANIAVLAAVAVLLHRLLRELGDRLTAAVGVLAFLTVFSCAQYIEPGNYNFITPYSHEMTHGTALSLAALVLLSIHLRRRGGGSLFGCGLAVGLTFLTKAQFFVAVAPAVAGALALDARLRGVPPRRGLPRAGLFASGALLPPLAAFLLLLLHHPAGTALRGTLGSWPYLFQRGLMKSTFYRDLLGTSDLAGNLDVLARWTLRYLALLAPAALAGWLLRPGRRGSTIAAVCLAPLAAAVALRGWRTTHWADLARPFPLLLLGGIPVLAALLARPEARPGSRRRILLALAFVLYSLLLLLKIFFKVGLFHYGFALAMPAAMAVVLGLLAGIPRLLDRRGRFGPAFRSASLGLLGALIFVHLFATHSWLQHRTVRVGAGADAFVADGRGRLVARILGRIEALRKRGETLVVLPEGVILNYLSRTPNPTPYVNFMPPEIRMFGEDRMVRALRAHPPDWIVMVDRSAPEYGYHMLGDDYGVKIVDWVERNYKVVEKLEEKPAGAPPLSLGMILRHAPARAGPSAGSGDPSGA